MDSTYHADIVPIQQELRELDLSTGVVAGRKLVQGIITRVTLKNFAEVCKDGYQQALLRGAKATQHGPRKKNAQSQKIETAKPLTTLSHLP